MTAPLRAKLRTRAPGPANIALKSIVTAADGIKSRFDWDLTRVPRLGMLLHKVKRVASTAPTSAPTVVLGLALLIVSTILILPL